MNYGIAVGVRTYLEHEKSGVVEVDAGLSEACRCFVCH